jgi:xylan 1,4-beta-xylosidase
MKKITGMLFLMACTVFAASQSPSFITYMNPVIPGDHPDCTITKVGNDFYTTGSSFNPTPVIYHSTDLVHWEAIAQPVSASWSNYGDKPGGGCWGGDIVFYHGEYWDFFGKDFVMYYVKATDPIGPWSDPVRVNNPTTLSYGLAADNSIFIDDDNKWYMLIKSGQPNNAIVELGSNGQPTGIVYDLKWLNPSPSYPYSWAEGPVMWKYAGYYYYSFARDVSGGQKVMRSKTITSDQSSWEMLGDFFNQNDPLIGTSLFTGPNHASQSIIIDDSTSWVIHPVYAKNDWKGQGRQGLLNQVKYNSKNRPVADYPVNQPFTAPKLPSSGIPWMVPKSDFFNSETLNPEWSFMGYTAKSKTSLTDRSGWLRLSPKSSVKANTIIKNDGEHNYSLITRVEFKPKSVNDEAGLRIIRGDETQFVKLNSSCSSAGKKIIVFSYDKTRYEAENNIGDTLWLKLIRVNHLISGCYSRNGIDWTSIGQAIDISTIDSYSDFSTWAGTRQGLYVQGTIDAYFDLYIYRDAYTPILAECPANQYGTTRSSLSNGIRNLDNIHPNDWVLYAGVEFGNGDYYDLADSIEFTASSASTGGNIQIWLDSIDTGTKIADCLIETTGSWSTFKTFRSPVGKVSGIHDVYLKFTGEGTDKLFQLKWIKFLSKSQITTGSTFIKNQKKISIYPNPVHNKLSINSNFPFNLFELIDMNGLVAYRREYKEVITNTTLTLNLKKGIYLMKLGNGKETSYSKIVIE